MFNHKWNYSLAVWMVALVLTLGCSLNQRVSHSTRTSSTGEIPGNESDSLETTESATEDGNLVVGIKNFRQLYASFTRLTALDSTTGVNQNSNIPGANPAQTLLAYFNSTAKDQLPLTGQVGEATASAFLTVTVLSANGCAVAIARESSLAVGVRQFLGSLNMTNNGTQSQLTPEVIREISERFVNQFMGRKMTDEENAILQAGVTEAMAGTTPSSQQLRNALLILCTGIAASLESISI